MKLSIRPLLGSIVLGLAASLSSDAAESLDYQDAPKYSGSKWHVHDGERPQPKIIAPGEFSTQAKAGSAPTDAVVLFDGKDFRALEEWAG